MKKEKAWENFYIDSSNRFAVTAVKTMQSRDRIIFSPITIFGEKGVGKTHLINTLVKSLKDKSKLVILDGNKIHTIKSKTLINELTECEIFIVDNIELFAHSKFEKELYDMLIYLVKTDRKILLTIGDSISQIERLEISKNILNIVKTGLFAEIEIPTKTIKNKIAKKIIKESHIKVDRNTLKKIVNENVTILKIKEELDKIKLKEKELKNECI